MSAAGRRLLWRAAKALQQLFYAILAVQVLKRILNSSCRQKTPCEYRRRKKKRRGGIERSRAHLRDFRSGVGVVWATIRNVNEHSQQDNHGVQGSATAVEGRSRASEAGQPRRARESATAIEAGAKHGTTQVRQALNNGRYAWAREPGRAAATARQAVEPSLDTIARISNDFNLEVREPPEGCLQSPPPRSVIEVFP